MSTSSITAPTPQERLASSRKAIIRHMTRDSQEHDHRDSADGEYVDYGQSHPGAGKWANFKHALRTWWHHHPLNTALDIGRPVIGKYAEGHPLKLLGIAAGVGAATALLKPWRLVSLGGVLLAALRSSELSGVALSMLSQPRGTKTNSQRQ